MAPRQILLFVSILTLSIYAWRNWYVAACATLPLMAVLQRQDMPHAMLGILGLNPWNVLVANVMLSWLVNRKRDVIPVKQPLSFRVALFCYVSVILVSCLRLLSRADAIPSHLPHEIVTEFGLNSVKWLLPIFPLFDGCTTRKRAMLGLACVLGTYLALALQVIKVMPVGAVVHGGMSGRAARVLLRYTGYYRVDLSVMFAGAAWGVLACLALFQRRSMKLALLGATAVIMLAQALTAGRGGYLAWVGVGAILAVLRWRRGLLLIPIAVVAIGALLPGVKNRVFFGVGRSEGPVIEEETDMSVVSAGRTAMWPYVIDKIAESPLTGYGRRAMDTTELDEVSRDVLGERHILPHNAYLEVLLDNGIIGFLLFMPIFLIACRRAVSTFRAGGDPLFVAVGGTAAALLLAQLIGGLTGQVFYPREGAVPMWGAIALMLRVSVERQAFPTGGGGAFAPAVGDDSELLKDDGTTET